MTELPPRLLDPDVAPGTPPAVASRAADVWCAHGVLWTHHPEGYLPVDEAHHDIPAREVGAIPAPCQPVTSYDPADYPNAGPHAVARARDEVRRLRAR